MTHRVPLAPLSASLDFVRTECSAGVSYVTTVELFWAEQLNFNCPIVTLSSPRSLSKGDGPEPYEDGTDRFTTINRADLTGDIHDGNLGVSWKGAMV